MANSIDEFVKNGIRTKDALRQDLSRQLESLPAVMASHVLWPVEDQPRLIV